MTLPSTSKTDPLDDPSFKKAHQWLIDNWFPVVGNQRFRREDIYRHFASELGQLSQNGHTVKADTATVTKRKKYIAQALTYMVQQGMLRLRGDYFQRTNNTLEEIAWWQGAAPEDVDIKLPCQLEQYCRFSRPLLGIVAGVSNAGKTAFMMKTIQLNEEKWGDQLYYFCSEGEMDLREKFQWLRISIPPKFHCYRRLEGFQDVVVPDGFNIIDYLRVKPEAMYGIQDDIFAIYSKLTTGIALIAIQKPPGRELGYGGMFTLFDPTFYISIDKASSGRTKIKFVKVKKPRIMDDGIDIYRRYIECSVIRGADMQKVSEGTED